MINKWSNRVINEVIELIEIIFRISLVIILTMLIK